MVRKETLDNYKKELFDLELHLEKWLERIIIESFSAKDVRDEVIRKIKYYRSHKYTDVFNPDIDRDQLVVQIKGKVRRYKNKIF